MALLHTGVCRLGSERLRGLLGTLAEVWERAGGLESCHAALLEPRILLPASDAAQPAAGVLSLYLMTVDFLCICFYRNYGFLIRVVLILICKIVVVVSVESRCRRWLARSV